MNFFQCFSSFQRNQAFIEMDNNDCCSPPGLHLENTFGAKEAAGRQAGNQFRATQQFARKCSKTKTGQLLFFAAPQIDREISTLPPPFPSFRAQLYSLSLPFCRGNRQGCHLPAESHPLEHGPYPDMEFIPSACHAKG